MGETEEMIDMNRVRNMVDAVCAGMDDCPGCLYELDADELIDCQIAAAYHAGVDDLLKVVYNLNMLSGSDYLMLENEAERLIARN